MSLLTNQVKTNTGGATRRVMARRGSVSKLHRARYGNWSVWAFVIPPFGLLILFMLWPAIYLAGLSTFKWDGLGPIKFVGLDNYAYVFGDDRFWLSLQHNVVWSVAALIFTPIVGLALAVLLTRGRPVGQSVFQVVYFLPQMVSSAIIAVIWRWIYYPNHGPANTLLASIGLGSFQPQWLADSNLALPALFVAHVWVACGFSMLIFQAAIRSIDESLFEAARMDGANWYDEIQYILVPGIRQALVTVLIVTAIWSFQIFDLIYLTTNGGPGDATYVLAIDIYSNTFAYRRVGIGAALSMILLLIVMFLATIFVIRRRPDQQT
jgi:ABC-type sugar transport system permease subunit